MGMKLTKKNSSEVEKLLKENRELREELKLFMVALSLAASQAEKETKESYFQWILHIGIALQEVKEEKALQALEKVKENSLRISQMVPSLVEALEEHCASACSSPCVFSRALPGEFSPRRGCKFGDLLRVWDEINYYFPEQEPEPTPTPEEAPEAQEEAHEQAPVEAREEKPSPEPIPEEKEKTLSPKKPRKPRRAAKKKAEETPSPKRGRKTQEKGRKKEA